MGMDSDLMEDELEFEPASSRSRGTILVVEDDPRLQRALRRTFATEQYAVIVAANGQAGLELFRSERPVAVILDLILPEISGRELCQTFKSQSSETPVIILSAISEVLDKVLLLELGADDYVTKPFSPKELLARVRAVLRRAQPPAPSERYSFANVSVDFAKMEVTRAGKPIPLTPHEFKALRYFVENPERVLSRDELLNQVWGYECYPSTRTVDNHILKLRQKLELDPANPIYIRTIHGAGYKFVPVGSTMNTTFGTTPEERKPEPRSPK